MSSKQMRISVIVPVYNQKENYLDECVSSICNQTYKNLEIILVDDGSMASCSKLCDAYCLKDGRIKVIHKENRGTASARKAGIQVASGDYVSFVDSDDWIEPDLYGKVTAMLAENEADIVSYGYYRNYENGMSMKVSNHHKKLYFERKDFGKEVFPYFIKTNDFFDTDLPIAIWCYLYKVDLAYAVAQKISDEIKTSEDYLFTLTALLYAKSFYFSPYVGYHYRCNVNSKTHKLKGIKELEARTYKAADNVINDSCCDEYNKKILKRKNLLMTYDALMLRDYSLLVSDKIDFLFPYTKVKRDSKILIYGVGKFGKQVYSIVKNNMNYEVVGITDKNWNLYKKQGLDVIAPEDILDLDYDYIIIAITYANIKNQAKKYLLELGISADKIAEIDLSVLDEEHLPF